MCGVTVDIVHTSVQSARRGSRRQLSVMSILPNIHMKKKIFACDLCSHQCTSATNLKRHKDEKHRSERFQCEFCSKNGKRTLFPRGPNLARHFRKCKYVLAEFPDALGAVGGKISDDWFPTGYKRGHHGMNRAKITPPNYLPVP